MRFSISLQLVFVLVFYNIATQMQHYIYTGAALTSGMNQNVGSVDRTLRTTAGAVAGTVSLATLVGTLPLPAVLSPVLGVIALVMLTTATMGTCPVYSAFGVDSCSRNATSQ